MVRALPVLLALAVAGCGGEPAERSAAPAAPTPSAEYPVAYAVARSDVRALARTQLPDALERAEVVAKSEWEPYVLLVLMEWLHEHRIDLDPPADLDAAASAMGDSWDASVVVIAAEHRRRYERRLSRLRPDRAELRDFSNEFNADDSPEAGRAMADWLDIVKRATQLADDRRVVVIPISD